MLEALLKAHPNLYISLTPEICLGKMKGLSRDDAIGIVARHASQCCLGTTARGVFAARPPEEFGELSYAEEVAALHAFADDVGKKAGRPVAAALRYRTAATIYGLDLPVDKAAEVPLEEKKKVSMVTDVKDGETQLKEMKKAEIARRMSTNPADIRANRKKSVMFLQNLAYGGATDDQDEDAMMAQFDAMVCPPSRNQKQWKTIDCHLHLLDFLQKSSGTGAALKAMDGCEVERAVVFGMPCCKKWCFYRPDQPLYYQDDNGPCCACPPAPTRAAPHAPFGHPRRRARRRERCPRRNGSPVAVRTARSIVQELIHGCAAARVPPSRRLLLRRPDGGGRLARARGQAARAHRPVLRLLRPDRSGGDLARPAHVLQVPKDVAGRWRGHVPPRRPDQHATE